MTSQAPEPCAGFLLKETPNALLQCICRFQRRYVALQGGKLFYADDEGAVDPDTGPPNCKGCIDFTKNDCEVQAEGETSFFVKPVGGAWKSASFTGADSGRCFLFDAGDSGKAAADWIKACQAHIQYAKTAASSPAAQASSESAPAAADVAKANEVASAKAAAKAKATPKGGSTKRSSLLASALRQEAGRRASVVVQERRASQLNTAEVAAAVAKATDTTTAAHAGDAAAAAVAAPTTPAAGNATIAAAATPPAGAAAEDDKKA
eukprot:TRINITY_DN2210_c1_g1_i2.p1 TRINITY_DN2210_c1_g1~~TRINITY_DN2210_c1_g1_i2.p1  ORF type:complete len:279 (-),score=88.28 TRINITY_DN2210_c1_g1_i2:143-934(-)